jgi:hypothetical protein
VKILTVVGARPQFVKAALVSETIARAGGMEVTSEKMARLEPAVLTEKPHWLII